jgi:hypothetical protein
MCQNGFKRELKTDEKEEETTSKGLMFFDEKQREKKV